ncbi:EF-hands domain-containing protein [Cryptosporidium ubiquitum]|uniref:EF-hands domain-containing protein n=1 Tax=Cryptosporidium ubiquitum TaxID=857276 RepID=A0A1J4MH55_9CRYT|nr:EF-hands domain-containing protein [Cryptosporidium ubiquitum]OII73335.1 EF-hands domain-containing protein [Cryptosporidium ubiquitum]
MISLLNGTGCAPCTSGCKVVMDDYKNTGRIEYGVFVGYYSESDESDYEDSELGTLNKKASKTQESLNAEEMISIGDELDEGEADIIKKMFEEASSQGKCTLEETRHLAHRMGLAPSNTDLERLKEETGDKVTYEDFERWIVSITHPEDHIDYMVSYFKNYDLNKTGKISRKQFVWLTSIGGDMLTREEAEAILDKLSIGGDVYYEDLLKKIMEIEASDKPMVNIGNKKSAPTKMPTSKVLVSQVSTTIRDLADSEAFLPTIDLLMALKATYGNELTDIAAKEATECCENREEAAKCLLKFYSEWAQNKGIVSRKTVRDLLMVWKAKLDQVSAEAWITSLCGTNEKIDIQDVLEKVDSKSSELN